MGATAAGALDLDKSGTREPHGATYKTEMTPPDAYTLEVPGTPKSFNRLPGGGVVPYGYIKEKKRWEADLSMALLIAGVPRSRSRVTASAVLTFRTRRKRDEGNFRVMLEKALGDALVKGGWLEDDTPDRYSFGSLAFTEEPGEAITVIKLEVQG